MLRKFGWLGLLAVFCLLPFLTPPLPARAAANSFSTALADHSFSRIAVDLSGDNAVYTAGNNSQDTPYVYKSTDHGGSWTLLNSGLPSPFSVFTLAVSASSPQTLYLGGYNFSSNSPLLYRSTNGGDAWSAVGSGLGANVSVQALAIDPTNANTVYLGANAGVYKATDGATFAALAGMGTRNVQALTLDPTNPAVIYAGTNPATDGGVWKSSNSGATWTQQNVGLPSGSGVYHLAATPGSSTTFYAAAGSSPTTTSLYKTTNAGGSWSALNVGSAVASVAVSPTNANLLFVDGSGGLYRSTDGGATFATIGSYTNAPVRLDNSGAQTLYVGGQGISSYTGDLTSIGTTTTTTSTGATGTTKVSGSLWYDTNGNYVRDSNEAAAAGAAVSIVCTSCAGTPTVGTTTADVNGNYTFSSVNVTSGQLYTVIATATRSGGPAVSSGPNESGESALDLAPGQNPTVNFGLVRLGGRYFPQTGYRIDNDTIWNYFQRRGGVTTFGYPTSRTFTLQGFTVQFFQRRIVQLDQSGNARLLNLLDPGLLNYSQFNGSTFPGVDSGLVSTAPNPTNQPAVLAWVKQHAPDTVGSDATNFYHTFSTTVSAQTAFPNGGDPSLLPGIELELWGVPTSGAFTDPNNHNFIYLRWQRGIMMYDASTGLTQGILLADYLKAIMTGKNLPSDVNQEAQGSPFLSQYDPAAPNWVHNQSLLPNTNLSNAFTQE
ncbi:MAG TPA: SdrD B-like domain-containing protein [Chloroflexota bacterium]|jgi:hypothetical protein|nr:SdrD B-like domain-containing protein [Chloroflexota bacterium]